MSNLREKKMPKIIFFNFTRSRRFFPSGGRNHRQYWFCLYTRRDGQAELARVAWSNINTVYLQTVTHLTTNPVRRNAVILLMRMKTLPLAQAARIKQSVTVIRTITGHAMQGRRSLWDRRDTSPQYLDWGHYHECPPQYF